MRGIAEILEEIEILKSTWKSWQDLEKLDLLERTIERYKDDEKTASGYSRASVPDSDDFAVIASAVPKELLIAVLSEHMDAIKQIYPKEYDLIIRKLRTA